MKGLATLIKLHKRTLDELRRKMVSLENQKNQLRLLSARLNQELEDEMQTAGKQPEMAHFFGDFATRIKKRQEGIAKEVQSLDTQMDKLGEHIAEAYAEVKKFEIAKKNIERRAAEAVKRKETIELDEIAGQQHRRKHKND